MEKAVPAFWYSIILEVWSFYLSEVLGVQVFETPKKKQAFYNRNSDFYVRLRIRGLETLVFRKILRTYLMDDPIFHNQVLEHALAKRSWSYSRCWLKIWWA